jgi:hypothetical protein
MNMRERKLALVLLSILGVGVAGFLFFELYWTPRAQHLQAIANAEDQIALKMTEIAVIEKKKKQLDQWNQLSLPRETKAEKKKPAETDSTREVNFAWLEYDQYLNKLVRDCQFSLDTIVTARPPDTRGPALKNKQSIYTRLEYSVAGRATLPRLVTFLEKFYRTNLLHRIKMLKVMRPATGGPDQDKNELRVDLTVEALVLDGAEHRKTLLPDENVRREVLAKESRSYASIAAKNIFLGPPQKETSEKIDVTPFVKLTDISYRDGRWEGRLFNVAVNHNQRIRPGAGFNYFVVLNEDRNVLMRGKVERMDDVREFIFSSSGKFYRMHVGQSLADAMGEDNENALSDEELRKLGLGEKKKETPTTGSTGQTSGKLTDSTARRTAPR